MYGGDDVIANFMVMTESNEDDAVQYLASNDFDLGKAVVQYQLDHPTTSHASPREEVEDAPSPSVDSGSPTSARPPASFAVTGYSSPTEPQRPATPPAPLAMASSSNETLHRMFSRPDYVSGSDETTLESECAKAAERHCWMVIAVVDNTFPCECFTRDVWRSDAMTSLMSGSVFCYEVNVTHSRGKIIAEKYDVLREPLPYLFIVDPVTMSKVHTLPLISNAVCRFEAAVFVDALMLFITSRDPPRDPFADGSAGVESREVSVTRDAGAGPTFHATVDEPVNVDADGDTESNGMSPPTVTSSAMSRPPAAAVVTTPPVTLEEFTVTEGEGDDPNVFKLRCRLPHSAPTLRLRPDTPVPRLVEFLAYTLHAEDPSRYPAPPTISIFSGFPPRNVTMDEMDHVTVSTWPGIRSGDVLMVRVNV